MAISPTSIPNVVNRFGSTTLAASITSGDVTITLADASKLSVDGGVIQIDSEIILFAARSSNTLSGCVRGQDGTIATSHSMGATVTSQIVAMNFNVLKTSVLDLDTGKFNIPAGTSNQYLAGDGSVSNFPTYYTADKTVLVARNSTGSTIAKGAVVYLSGATGNRPNMILATSATQLASSQTIGLLSAALNNNTDGEVITSGQLTGVNTSAFSAGDLLYLGSSPGTITNVKPIAPAHMVHVGFCTVSNPSNGIIDVTIQNGYQLDELHNVLITSPVNDQVLQYESSSSLWKNKTSNLNNIIYFGDGSAGDLTISAGTTTITGDTFYNNLTINGTGKLSCQGCRLFVKGVLDISSAAAESIFNISTASTNGIAATTTAGGAAGTPRSTAIIGGSLGGGAGGSGIVGGVGGVGAVGIAATTSNGGSGGNSGVAGVGASGGGGSTRAGGAASTPYILRRFETNIIRGATVVVGGGGGAGGNAGGGDATNAGGGGGGGGAGGATTHVYANTITTGGSTAAGAIASLGGRGGNGASSGAGTNNGGGAGGGGGGGGFIYLVYATKIGTAVTNLITATGGDGGTGGNGFGTGTAGAGGIGGNGGTIILVNVTDQTTTLVSGSAGGSNSGTTGGTGGACVASL